MSEVERRHGAPGTDACVEIALATFDGARFIEEQLDSYVAQTFHDWSLVVRDDGSKDDTVERIRAHAAKHGYPLRFTGDSGEHRGYPETFFSLLEQTRAPYVLFSDQDDVWLPEKLQLFVDALDALPSDRPALVHSDLTVVDEHLRTIQPSFLRSLHVYPPKSSSVLGLLACVYVTGGAAGLNARAREAVRRPRAKVGHDGWIALTCAALGTVRFLDHSTVLYRQHGRNVVGAGRAGRKPVTRFWQLSYVERAERNRAGLRLAEDLLDLYDAELSDAARADIRYFATLDERGPLALWKLCERGVLPDGRDVRRRILWNLAKMQLKERVLRLESILRAEE